MGWADAEHSTAPAPAPVPSHCSSAQAAPLKMQAQACAGRLAAQSSVGRRRAGPHLRFSVGQAVLQGAQGGLQLAVCQARLHEAGVCDIHVAWPLRRDLGAVLMMLPPAQRASHGSTSTLAAGQVPSTPDACSAWQAQPCLQAQGMHAASCAAIHVRAACVRVEQLAMAPRLPGQHSRSSQPAVGPSFCSPTACKPPPMTCLPTFAYLARAASASEARSSSDRRSAPTRPMRSASAAVCSAAASSRPCSAARACTTPSCPLWLACCRMQVLADWRLGSVWLRWQGSTSRIPCSRQLVGGRSCRV